MKKLSFYNTFFGGSIDGDNIVSTDFYWQQANRWCNNEKIIKIR